jgi:hypothetical protein
LPAAPYEYAEWKKAPVHLDYHIELAAYYYSVPHKLIGKDVEARMTARIAEIFHRRPSGAVCESWRKSVTGVAAGTIGLCLPSRQISL